MAKLHWDVTQIRDHEDVCFDVDSEGTRTLSVVTEVLIWGTIGTGIGKITQQNWTDFYARMKLLGAIHGPAIIERDDDDNVTKRDITPEEVHAHIGLKTNVSPKETETKFLNRHVKRFLSTHRRAAESAYESAAVIG